MKAKVDESLCIGAANCEGTCPAVFKVVDGLSQVQVEIVPKAEEAKAKKAMDGCPSGAITLE